MRFHSLFDNSFDAVLLTRPDGSILSANPAACFLFGMTEEEIKLAGRDGLLVIDEKVKLALLEREKKGKAMAELAFKRKDGSTFQGEVTSSLFTDTDGIVKSSMIIRDITERKRAEEKLRLSEERYRSLFEQAGEYILVLELPIIGVPIIKDANSAALKVHGYSREEMINQPISIIDKQFTEDDTKELIRKVSGGDVVVFEVIHQRKDGTSFTAEVSAKAIKLGSETWILTIERDITEKKKAQEALKESEERYSKLASATFEGIMISRAGIILDLNNQLAEMYGYKASDLIGKEAIDLVAPCSKTLVKTNMEKGYEGLYEFLALKKDGAVFLVETRAKSIFYKGSIARVSAVYDITKRKKNEETLRVFSSIFELASDAIYVCDLKGEIVYFNEATYKQMGYSKDEMVKLNLFEYSSPQAAKLIEGRIEKVLEKGYAVFESEHLAKDGTKIPVEVSSRIIESNGRKLLLNVARDISERKKAQEALKKSEERYQMITDNMKDIVMLTDENFVFCYISPSIESNSGFSSDELIGKSVLDFIHPEDIEKVIKPNLSRLYRGDEFDSFEARSRTKDGSYLWLESNVKLIYDSTGEKRLVVVSRNIEKRKKIERDLTVSLNLVELANDQIHVTDVAGKLIFFNEATYKSLGYSKEEMSNMTIQMFETPESAQILDSRNKELIEKGSIVFETWHISKNKSLIPVEVHSKLINLDDKSLVLSIVRDISERKKVEKKLKQSDLIFENSMDMICIAGFDGYLKVLNPAWSRTLGWSNEELLSRPWIEFVFPEDREATINAKTTLVKGQEVFQFENRYICKDGSIRWLSWNSFPDPKEKIIFAVTRDITERKDVEDRLALVNEKLRVTGSLTRHDVRNKLTIIKSNIYLLKKRIGDSPELANILKDIDSAVEASNKLFEFSSTYEKIGAEPRSRINIGEYFDQASGLLNDLQKIEITNDCKELIVMADSLIRQLFYNLLDNSLKHGERVNHIRLYFDKQNDETKLFYEDDGVGISQANKAKLFTEGFTTGNGSGLGLLLIKKMVEAYGWTISEEGQEGYGVKFVIRIPKNTYS